MGFVAKNWQTISSMIGAIGGLLGALALMRTVWRERSHLQITQKPDKRFSTYKKLAADNGILTLTLFISNLSSHANSVLQFHAKIMNKNGVFDRLGVEQGRTVSFGMQGIHQGDEFSVTPVNVPPHSSVEALLKFHGIGENKYQSPFVLQITALDMHGKKFTGEATVRT